ncbi:hypothetical protein ACIBAC_43985 [Streptomyces sp. NPDC051362]|uniref:hypothetical protein n=1 Tax=Streptomyces sp. NPDC051362 TaxID=3365651 RepID=UPI0037BAB9AA
MGILRQRRRPAPRSAPGSGRRRPRREPARHHGPQRHSSDRDRNHRAATKAHRAVRRLDDILGGGDTYRVYSAEYQITKGILRTGTYSEAVLRELLALLAEQAQQAGWAAFDGGREREAPGLYRESRSTAEEAGAGDLARNALAFLAYQAGPTDPQAAATIAARSCAAITEQTPATVRALLWERYAWALAVAGDASGTDEALHTAGTALDSADADEPQPDWSAWVGRAELEIMAGRC